MSYNNRPRPNVSQYIANLNTIPTAHELAQQDLYPAEDDLAMFVNADFFDFDAGDNFNMNPPPIDYDPVAEARARQQHATAFKGDVFNGGDFHYPDFSNYPNIAPDATAYSPTNTTNAAVPYPIASSSLSSPTAASPTTTGPHVGDKRKLDVLVDPLAQANMDEHARMAAEEDKRRRNTAASARFRVKKKQREQALEKAAKEMTEKVDRLESKVQQLEMENKWLKGLITEKNDGKVGDMAELFKQFVEKDASSREERKKGVGTEKEQA